MPGWVSASAPLVAALALAGTPDLAAADAESRTVLTFADERITESSGLVDAGERMLTVNDSGDDPLLYVVDKRSGTTVATVRFSRSDVADVEALAPARGGVAWVGDIGDNNRARPFVEVFRVPRRPAEGHGDRSVDAPRFRLVYPDGPHDAEALLSHPRTGRLYVVSKWVTGGTVFAAPRSLRAGEVNRLEALGRVPGLVTDGAFFPDGRHLILRSYGGATVYTFPELREVGTFPLPPQEQGEGVAVDDDGRVYVSTEGQHTDVLQVDLPTPVVHAMGDEPHAAEAPNEVPDAETATPDDDPPGIAGGVAVLLLLGSGLAGLLLRASRRRGRHTR